MTTKAEIEATLDVARRQLICADMIDNFERRERELTYWRTRVSFLEADLASLERWEREQDGFNPFGSGPTPIEERKEP